jgi:predicted small secreted protein
MLLFVVLMTSGCETWRGVKKDTSDGAEWSKEKVNDGAKYIEKKTE